MYFFTAKEIAEILKQPYEWHFQCFRGGKFAGKTCEKCIAAKNIKAKGIGKRPKKRN